MSDPRLRVDVQTTRQYYNQQSKSLSRIGWILGITVGSIMAIGAIGGALNTMDSAVAARAREIATLRALGFGGLPLVVAVLLETLLLATAGGLLGAAVAWVIFDGFTTSTLGTGGLVMFSSSVSPELLWSGLKWALAMGFIAGLLPAVNAVRVPIGV